MNKKLERMKGWVIEQLYAYLPEEEASELRDEVDDISSIEELSNFCNAEMENGTLEEYYEEMSRE